MPSSIAKNKAFSKEELDKAWEVFRYLINFGKKNFRTRYPTFTIPNAEGTIKHPGGSGEFFERREYVPFDPVSRVDWKVYARTEKYYVKEFEREASSKTVIVLDNSNSMNVGFKKIALLALGSAITWLADKARNAVEIYFVVSFNGKMEIKKILLGKNVNPEYLASIINFVDFREPPIPFEKKEGVVYHLISDLAYPVEVLKRLPRKRTNVWCVWDADEFEGDYDEVEDVDWGGVYPISSKKLKESCYSRVYTVLEELRRSFDVYFLDSRAVLYREFARYMVSAFNG